MPTCPVAAVELDPHADSAWVRAVGDDAYFPGHDGWSYLTQHRHVRVLVAVEYLETNKQKSYQVMFSLNLIWTRYSNKQIKITKLML